MSRLAAAFGLLLYLAIPLAALVAVGLLLWAAS